MGKVWEGSVGQACGDTWNWRELRGATGSSGELQGTDGERLGRGVWGGQGSVERGTEGGVLSGGERPDTQRDGKMGD